MMVHVGDDLWVNPQKVEIVFLKNADVDGTPHEPYVVIAFQGGTGRSLPPSYSIEHVTKVLNESERPKIINTYTQNSFDWATFIGVLAFVISMIAIGVVVL